MTHRPDRFPGGSVCASLLGAAALLATPKSASGQAIERHLPPAAQPQAPVIAPATLTPSDQDATPIGPVLSGLVTLGGADPAIGAPGAGVDISRTPRLKHDRARLHRFLGRPLSRKLIAQIEAEIANAYRRAGHPFVNLTTPQQEITSGVLQVRVLEFHLGAKTAPGADAKDAAYIESRVRAQPGDPIDSNLLAQDLDWLNRFAFRKTDVVFTPAADPGGTDLLLKTTTSAPWSVNIGYANSGSPLTGWDRYFGGAATIIPGLNDAVVSYQFTGSPDVFANNGTPFDSADAPQYISQAGRIVIPTLPRQDIEASANFVQSNQPVQKFSDQQTTLELSLAYRSALSNFAAALPGEVLVGIEAKREDSLTTFGGAFVKSDGIDVFQLLLGYAFQGNDVLGRTSGELNLHISPGGIDGLNTGAAFSAFSSGQFDRSTYAYIGGDITRDTRLPALLGVSGFVLVNSVIGQYAPVPVPQTEEMGIGGQSLVRGYTLDDGAFDSAVVFRNELRAPSFTAMRPDQVSPYAFVDAGYGDSGFSVSQGAYKAVYPVSTGLGLDYQFGAHFSASLDGAWALTTAGLTPAGTVRLESRVTLSF